MPKSRNFKAAKEERERFSVTGEIGYTSEVDSLAQAAGFSDRGAFVRMCIEQYKARNIATTSIADEATIASGLHSMIMDYRHHNFNAAIKEADHLTLFVKELSRFLTLYDHNYLLLKRMADGKPTVVLLAADSEADQKENSAFCDEARILAYSPRAKFSVVEAEGIAPAFILVADDFAIVSTFSVVPALHRSGTHFASVWQRSDSTPSLGFKTVRMMLDAKLSKPKGVVVRAEPGQIYIARVK